MIYIVLIYFIVFLFGFHLNWVENPYDEARLFQIVLVVILGAFYLLKSDHEKIKKKSILIVFIIFIAIFLARGDDYKNLDLILWLNVFILFIVLKKIFFNNDDLNKFLFLSIVLIVFSHIFLFFSLYNLINNSMLYDWQMSYGSIRILNSVIVPFFWLSLYLKDKDRYFKYFYPCSCYFISLGLFVDGARSALISLILPLIIIFFIDSNYRKVILKTFLIFLFSYFTYHLSFYLHDILNQRETSLSIARISTSYRAEMWKYMFEQWKMSPLIGTGGGFLAKIEYPYGHHMHNLYLRLIFEWGALGVIVLCLLITKFYQVMRSNLNLVLKMGLLAIAIDAMFSGNFIYPASQAACVSFIAIVFSKMSEIKDQDFKSKYSQKYFFLIIYIVYLFLVIIYLREDLMCVGCSSQNGRAAPFFWENGGVLHLNKFK